MKVLLLRPPRYLWPFNSETSAFWQPLGLLSLAAALRRSISDVNVQVWDAPADKMGWKTLQRRLTQHPIDLLGLGEETVSAHEALRAAQIVKDLYPNCLTVAGGAYFAHSVESTFAQDYIDVIVRGEGEITFVELVKNINNRDNWPAIPGLAFRRNGQTVITTARKLIEDMDDLPLAAYDLINMDSYGRNSRNHPNLVSVEHSRGCIDSCSFCILWKQMGQSVNGNGQIRPCWRTKGAQRTFDEVIHLYHKFNRRTFGWVDPTFNVSAEWSDQWADLMLGSELCRADNPKTLHTAWLRADCVIRDEKQGVLKNLVRAGLRQVMIGVERDDQAGLETLNKHNNSAEICREAFAIFREKYPQVYTIATMIYGLPNDTANDLKRLLGCQYTMNADYCFMMPLTPNPGADLSNRPDVLDYRANQDLTGYNFHTPVCNTNSLNLRDLESVYWRIMFNPNAARFTHTLRTLFTERDPRKRKVHLALLKRGTGIALKSLARRIIHPNSNKPTVYSRRPSWYNN